MNAAAQGGVDSPANDGPFGTPEAFANLRIGDAQTAKLILDALEGLVDCCEVDVLAGGAAVGDDSVGYDEGAPVGAGLAGAETDGAELRGLAGDGENDDIALAAAGVVLDVCVDYSHLLHG